jgi:hypothetical protein
MSLILAEPEHSGHQRTRDNARLSFVHIGDWALPDTANVFLYPGAGISPHERARAERRLVRCCIRDWPAEPERRLFPEHFDPDSLRWALQRASTVFVSPYSSRREFGEAINCSDCMDRYDPPPFVTTIELPRVSMSSWLPVLERWAPAPDDLSWWNDVMVFGVDAWEGRVHARGGRLS